MSKIRSRSTRIPLPAQPAAPTDPAAPTPGGGLSAAELIRRSNLWRDNYNPLRALTIVRVMAIFEAAERGAYAELQLTLRKVMKRFPVLKALRKRRLSAIQKLDWTIKIREQLPPGVTPAMAQAQADYLRSRYELITNLREAFGQIALAEFRGYTILQKHRYEGGTNDGAVRELYWLEPWCFAREGFYGDFYYNADSRIGVGLGGCATILGEANRIGGADLPREEFVIREVEDPLYEIALIAFINWLLGRKDWAAFTEIFGIPNAVVIMPANIPQGKEADYQAAAQQVADGVSGAIPNGADVKFPGATARGEDPFEKFCGAQEKDVVLAGTGGLLTMLSMPQGIGKGSTDAHQDAFDEIGQADALKISETLQGDFDRPELEAEFHGQPIVAYFELASKDEVDVGALVKDVTSLATAGYEADVPWLNEKTGYKLKLAPPAPAPMLPPKGGDPAEPDPEDTDPEDDPEGSTETKPGTEEVLNRRLRTGPQKILNGDVAGHEFHGNQFVAAGQSAEAKSTLALADHSPLSHQQAAEAHGQAAAAYRGRIKEVKADPHLHGLEKDQLISRYRQHVKFHQQMAAGHQHLAQQGGRMFGDLERTEGTRRDWRGLRNRAVPAAPGHLYAALAADLAPLRGRLEAILQIQDPEIFKARLTAFLASLEGMKADLAADPETARALEGLIAQSFVAGLSGQAPKK